MVQQVERVLDELNEKPAGRAHRALANRHPDFFFEAFGSHTWVTRSGAASPGDAWRAASGAALSLMQKWIDRIAALITAERVRGAAPDTIPAHDLATSLNLMNERVMLAAFAAEQPSVEHDQRRRHPDPHLADEHLRQRSVICRHRCEHVFVGGASRATILHADLDSFYASVEQRDDPALRGRPVIVGGGVVLAASYEAKAYGVRTAMSGVQARRLCPHAVVVPPRMSAYSAASDAVFDVFRDTTPVVEPLSVDEAFLESAGCAESRVRRWTSPSSCAPTCASRSACPSR